MKKGIAHTACTKKDSENRCESACEKEEEENESYLLLLQIPSKETHRIDRGAEAVVHALRGFLVP